MERPEKIYLYPSDRAGIDYDEEWLESPCGENSIEYICTDVFIEKACNWLSKNSPNYINYFISHDFGKFVEDFRKSLEGGYYDRNQSREMLYMPHRF